MSVKDVYEKYPKVELVAKEIVAGTDRTIEQVEQIISELVLPSSSRDIKEQLSNLKKKQAELARLEERRKEAEKDLKIINYLLALFNDKERLNKYSSEEALPDGTFNVEFDTHGMAKDMGAGFPKSRIEKNLVTILESIQKDPNNPEQAKEVFSPFKKLDLSIKNKINDITDTIIATKIMIASGNE